MSDILSDWTNQHSLLLIHEYRKYPVLWNSRHKYHFNKNRKQDAWQNIASVCRASVEEVRKKMQSLLGSFRREKKKMHRIAASKRDLIVTSLLVQKTRICRYERDSQFEMVRVQVADVLVPQERARSASDQDRARHCKPQFYV